MGGVLSLAAASRFQALQTSGIACDGPTSSLSPVMQQYLDIKKKHPGTLLFFRMGDFFELFFEDAVVAAKELDIVLTKRGKQGDGVDIPMCGVPVGTYETYLARLIGKGYKVAICEQLEDPEEARQRNNRGLKGPLKRDVVRVVTPGTLTEEGLLDSGTHNFLVALTLPLSSAPSLGVASFDLSTGAFLVEDCEVAMLPNVLARINPAEIVLPDILLALPEYQEALAPYRSQLSPLPKARFDLENGKRRLQEAYQVRALDGFGLSSSLHIVAAGVLLDYVTLCHKAAVKLMARPHVLSPQAFVGIDAATRRSLEVEYTQKGSKKGSLLSLINHTLTAGGARLLALRLSSPLTHVKRINDRLDSVEFFFKEPEFREAVRATLKGAPDMERALGRLNLGRGGPRDLASLRDGLSSAKSLSTLFRPFMDGSFDSFPVELQKQLRNLNFSDSLQELDQLYEKLSATLTSPVPFQAKEGNFIASGYDDTLDELRALHENGKQHISRLQEVYADKTGIPTLKVRFNNILGYHIEITALQAGKLPEEQKQEFIHRQTLASAMRFTTPELNELASRIERAAAEALALELKIFGELVAHCQDLAFPLAQVSRALSIIDVASSLAELAYLEGYVRPLVDDSVTFHIEGGWHPVVAQALRSSSNGATPFVANDCMLDETTQLVLLTGPNMAGKSTYLRQNAVIAILAQAGSFVPAQKAHIGVVDRLFSRVGASDDLSAGRSTFMVEMIETAFILHHATPHSFVILDEVGRGTSTFDGLSIAWAVVETLLTTNKTRGLFATHYHELTALADSYSQLALATMDIQEWQDQIVFLHQVKKGAADKSYGIHVAALAGLPEPTLQRAQAILAELENPSESGKIRKGSDAPSPQRAAEPALPSPLLTQLQEEAKELNINHITPLESLAKLAEWQKKLIHER